MSKLIHENLTTSTARHFCLRHKNELLKFYCHTCEISVCKDCMITDHPKGQHDCEHKNEATPKQLEKLLKIMKEVQNKADDMQSIIKNTEDDNSRIQVQYEKAQKEINQTHQFYCSMLDERKQELLIELESFLLDKKMLHTVLLTKTQEKIDTAIKSCEFVKRVTKHAGLPETIMLKRLMENKLESFVICNRELQSNFELDFLSNYQAIQVGVRNTFGYIRASAEESIIKQSSSNNDDQLMTNGNVCNQTQGGSSSGSSSRSLNDQISRIDSPIALRNGIVNEYHNLPNALTISSNNNVMNFGVPIVVLKPVPFFGDNQPINFFDNWSNGVNFNVFNNNLSGPLPPLPHVSSHSDNLVKAKLISSTIFPPKSQIKRQKMIYHCKFGEFGIMEGQFIEPSGITVNEQNNIIVADTNNHRIQLFDNEGRYKFHFGECGKRDGQLLYPNRVTVIRPTGDIIVTERSPTHQLQIFNQYGQFVRKFGANILQHPRGVTVDNEGRILVVECKIMRVIIFDQTGNVLKKFGCCKHLEFPNGIVVNDKQEIFISDNRAHCVKVFNYEGVFLRQIGGAGITNYPIGVGINAAGDILIADNHNNFNLTIFSQNGQLVSAFESKVKHAQCFDIALMDNGNVVMASKDYRLYVYRYIQVP